METTPIVILVEFLSGSGLGSCLVRVCFASGSYSFVSGFVFAWKL